MTKRLELVAWLLDDSIRIPILGRRIGLDSLMGLIPGVGDAVGGLLSTYVLIEGLRLGASKATLARMIGNVAIEVIVGFVPLIGDLFDMGWKSNVRNVKLLRDYAETPGKSARSNLLVVIGVVVFLVAAAVVTVGAGVWVLVRSVAYLAGLF
jgi:hypothetical protein